MVEELVLVNLTYSCSTGSFIAYMRTQDSSKYFNVELFQNSGMKLYLDHANYIEGSELRSIKLTCAGHFHVQINSAPVPNQKEQ